MLFVFHVGVARNHLEVQLYQDGLDQQTGNILNFLSKKVSPAQFGFQAVKDVMNFVKKIQKKDHTHEHLQIGVKVNDKNVFFGDVFEDGCKLFELLQKRARRIMDEKKVDLTMGGVLIDTKVLVPTISGIPLVYKLVDNAIVQVNAQVVSSDKKVNLDLNHSVNFGLQAGVKLVLKDQKMGYEYDSKLSFTPELNIDFEKGDDYVMRLNLPDKGDHAVLRLQQSLKEKRSDGVTTDENELAPLPRSSNCHQFFRKF